MPNDDASGGRNWRAVPPTPRPRRSIGPVIRGAREPTVPSGGRRAGRFACERGSDIYQGTRQGTRVDREVRGRAWCDSIRKRQSAIRPNALRIGHTPAIATPPLIVNRDH